MAAKRVVVAGGGVGGLAFAAIARRAGFDVRVFERSPDVARASAGGGLGLWPPSQAVLAGMDALGDLEARGAYMPPPVYCDSANRVLGRPGPRFSERFPILCVERPDLLAVLRACCDAVVADVVVGCDGIHSAVRGGLPAPACNVAPQHCGYVYFRACVDVDVEEGATNAGSRWHQEAFESWGDGMRFGFVPMKPPSVFWFAAIPVGHDGLKAQPGAARLDATAKAWLERQFAGWEAPVPLGVLLAQTPAEEVLRTDIHKVPGVTKFNWASPTGRVVLLGDAAHATAPNLAQGAGLSIEDAAELGLALQQAARRGRWPSSRAAAVAAYTKRRKRRAWTVQTMADAVACVGQGRGRMIRSLHALMRAAAGWVPALQQRVFEGVVSHSLGGGARCLYWLPPALAVAQPAVPPAAAERYSPAGLAAGASFAKANHPVRAFRARVFGGRGTGTVTVERGASPMARLLAAAARLPRAMVDEPFTAWVAPAAPRAAATCPSPRHIWTRVFGDADSAGGAVRYWTGMEVVRCLGEAGGATGMVLTEGVGGAFDRCLRFGYAPRVAGERVEYVQVGTWVGAFRLPFPQWALPTSQWWEAPTPRGDGWAFSGVIRLPRLIGGGVLMKYCGQFSPESDQWDGAGSPPPRRCVVVLGGTGCLGRELCRQLLHDGGASVVVMSRSPAAARTHALYEEVLWDPSDAAAAGASLAAVLGEGAKRCGEVKIVNLAGENPGARRWVGGFPTRIHRSRIEVLAAVRSALTLFCRDAPARAHPVRVHIFQASATGAYGERGAAVLTEATRAPAPQPLPTLRFFATSAHGAAFRAACCQELEEAAHALAAAGSNGGVAVATTSLRIGLIADPSEGLFPYLSAAAACGVTSFGNSDAAWCAWIHRHDAARMIAALVAADAPPAVANIAARHPVLFRDVLAALRREAPLALPVRVPVPQRLCEALIGASSSMFLTSHRVAGSSAEALRGFEYKYATVDAAARAMRLGL
eukprot:TRINITY_DN2293_c0_g1_i11.p1 TRINITY_DN2293_c0_g1~~TRINITY_DN2293_c0_g1_i11.p1  ORF type:complete len:987 (+),score=203.23 TRINITY_DN2293_c0_g1_i11:58-3018(+)